MEHLRTRIQIDVSYQLGEYRQLLSEVIAVEMATENEPVNRANPWNWSIVREQRQQLERLLASVPVVILESVH